MAGLSLRSTFTGTYIHKDKFTPDSAVVSAPIALAPRHFLSPASYLRSACKTFRNGKGPFSQVKARQCTGSSWSSNSPRLLYSCKNPASLAVNWERSGQFYKLNSTSSLDSCLVLQPSWHYSRKAPGRNLRCVGLLRSSPNDNVERCGEDNDALVRNLTWASFALYMLWLLLLPYAPGDPVWAIKGETIKMLQELSLNFFYILPILDSVGLSYIEAPVLHPTSEALFNLINAWSLMFGPLLVADRRRQRWGGSVELLWIAQMLLTNIFLLPYMALRLNPRFPSTPPASSPSPISFLGEKLGEALISGAKGIAVTSFLVGLVSIPWFVIGRPDAGFGDFSNRWAFFVETVTSDRASYAFLFDIVLYSIFQAWLIGDNLESNAGETSGELTALVRKLRFVPFFGLAGYLFLWPLKRKCEDF